MLLGGLVAIAALGGSALAARALLEAGAGPAEGDEAPVPIVAGKGKPGTAPTTGSGASRRTRSPLAPGAAAAWAELERTLPARVGASLEPLGSGRSHSFGSLQLGHAWSTIKVPIVVTLMREGGVLDAEEEAWARAALTASDNDAAAALFGRIEAARGGLTEASEAVEATLRAGGDRATAVATAPPPSGAVSTYGQTEWSLTASTRFFASLARGCLLDRAGTENVLRLGEEVVPEQSWGLGEAGLDQAWRVAFKGGWGPERSASGPYLVRQSGVLRHGDTGIAVAIAAEADTGTFEAGVAALDLVAAWLADNLRNPMSEPRSPAGCSG